MTAAEVILDVRFATGDTVYPYKQKDALFTEWIVDAVTKLLLQRPDAYTGYSASDIDFTLSVTGTGTLVVNNKFRPNIVGWVLHRAGLAMRNQDLAQVGLMQFKDGLDR